MNQSERRRYLIDKLLSEKQEYENIDIPENEFEQRRLLRGLMNVRMPESADPEFLKVQDAYLKEEISKKGIVSLDDIQFNEEGLAIWQGDITRLSKS